MPSNTEHEALADCVCGILFLGIPHKGSYTTGSMDVVNDLLESLLGRPADVVIKKHLQEVDQLHNKVQAGRERYLQLS